MAVNVYQAVKQAVQDLVAPQLESLRGDIQGLRGELSGTRGEMNGLRAEMRAELSALRAEMQGGHAALSADIRRVDDKLTWAVELRERIATLEAKLATAQRS